MPTILIVDDDTDLLRAQEVFLAGNGHEVVTATSMKEGLERIEDTKPDLVLVDLMMEHYDSGLVFCKKMRDDPHLSDVPILMQTAAAKEVGFTFDASDPKAKEWMKVDEVLTKPVPLDHLLGTVDRYLSR